MVALHPEGVDRNKPYKSKRALGDGVALHPEGVDRNMYRFFMVKRLLSSPSTRRAWIEIQLSTGLPQKQKVALHPEGVDRNQKSRSATTQTQVALHPEGVDRNYALFKEDTSWQKVALHPEGVDRNCETSNRCRQLLVALHPEGVDRNLGALTPLPAQRVSPSTRRAWIEIFANEPR